MFSSTVKSVNGSGSFMNNNLTCTNKKTADTKPAPANGTFVWGDGHMDYKDANGDNEKCSYNFVSMWNRGPGGWFAL